MRAPHLAAPRERLLVCLEPKPDESIPGLLQRHCAANYVRHMSDVLRHLGQVTGESYRDIDDVLRSRPALRALERLMDLADGALQSGFIAERSDADAASRSLRGGIPAARSNLQPVCPGCLEESGYVRRAWACPQAPVCLVHGTALVDRCNSCGQRLSSRRTSLVRCQHCEADLRLMPTEPVSDSCLRLAKAIQSEGRLHLVQDNRRYAMLATDVVGILRMCIPTGPGRSTNFGLSEALADLPIETRIAGLARMSLALDGADLDGNGLHDIILARWPMASHLPLRTQHALVLRAAAQATLQMALTMAITGQANRPRSTATERLNGRIPRLHTPMEVATFLGLDPRALADLRSRQYLEPPLRGQAHDMDHVLRLGEYLTELPTVAELDAAFGLPGLTYAFMDLNRLQGVITAEGVIHGVFVDSLEVLLSDLQMHLAPREHGGTRTTTLGQALTQGIDIRSLAWTVSQVCTGSLRAFDWPQPCRLADLVVDEKRLKAIVRAASGDTAAFNAVASTGS